MTRPAKTAAAITSAGLSLLFMGVYGACNWITAQRSDVGTWYYAWERYIPFVPLMIIPYMSIDLFFVVGPFLCQKRDELRAFAQRIAFAIIVAGAFFLAMPLQMGITLPQPDGWTGSIFKFLHGFDRPTNLFPSLHITLRTILADLYARHSKGVVRVASHVWFSLIGFSTLLTYQHHFVDIVGGFVLATFCFYLFQEGSTRWPVIPNYRIGVYYTAGSLAAMGLAFTGWPWTSLLLWPALSLGIVAAGYFSLGPAIYKKTNGTLPLSAKVILAPCLLGQYVSLLYYRRQCKPWNQVIPRIWIGTKLSQGEAVEAKHQGVTAVLDLTAEFSETAAFLGLVYRNVPILDLTRPNLAQLEEAVGFITQQAVAGTVYVHCKVGYSRTAAVVGAYLLASNHARTSDQAVTILRTARPSIVIRPEAHATLAEFEALMREKDQTNPNSVEAR